MMSKIEIGTNRHNACLRFSCGICGGLTGKDGFSFTFKLDGIEKIKDVCPDCLDAGPAGAGKRANECAERMQENVYYFQAVANQLKAAGEVEGWIDSKTFYMLRDKDNDEHMAKAYEAIPAFAGGTSVR